MNMTVLFKKYTYGLLLAATTLITFCSAGSITYNGHYEGNDLYAGSVFAINPFKGNDIGGYIDYECTFSNFNGDFSSSSNNSKYYLILSNSYNGNGIENSNFGSFNSDIIKNNLTFSGSGLYNYSSTKVLLGFGFNLGFRNTTSFSFDYSCTLSGPQFGSSSCDYSDYELKSNITESYCTNKFNTLIPVSAVDSNYCSTNGLCPYDCPEGTGDIQWSALYINEIQHQGNENINITIPEEIERDYANVDDTVDIEITGYGYDQDKMQQLVNTQYYTPTGEDMANLVGKIADFLPLLAIMLLIVRTWYLIKKVF